jgi:hypothetical protein
VVVGFTASCLLGIAGSIASAQEAGVTAQEGFSSWGVKRNWGLAIGEVVAINKLVWFHNEYIRGADFTQVNPSTWRANLEHGFEWDDNQFHNNQFAHPFHGSLYYNAGRSNGFNYWGSLLFAVGGSFLWECCGETHPMAINDWINTSVGGAAIGEIGYRLSSTVLDNTATGAERTWRELGALVLNPIRGLNRLGSGRWSDVWPKNPPDRFPPRLSNTLLAGARVIGEGQTLAENRETHGLFEVEFEYGTPFGPRNRSPFDYFIVNLEINVGDKTPIGRLQIGGNLYSKPLNEPGKTQHVFAVSHHFDYANNNAFEFGGQSVGAALLSRFMLSDKVILFTQGDVRTVLLGAVNSEYAFLADVPDRERLREYDYGPGLDTNLRATLYVSGLQVASILYGLTWIHTLNGSVIELPDESGSTDTDHLIQVAGIRGRLPITRNFALGADRRSPASMR